MANSTTAARRKRPAPANNTGFSIEQWPIDKVIPYERNPRAITDKAVEKVAASIKEFGWRQPIVVDGNGVILAGHTRWRAAKHLGLKKVPVVVAADLSPEKARAYRIADNRTAEETDWDNDLLTSELEELSRLLGEEGLPALGFDEKEINKLLAETHAAFLDEHIEEGAPERDDGEVPNDGLVSLQFMVTPEERRLIMAALKRYALDHELDTTAQALVHLAKAID